MSQVGGGMFGERLESDLAEAEEGQQEYGWGRGCLRIPAGQAKELRC